MDSKNQLLTIGIIIAFLTLASQRSIGQNDLILADTIVLCNQDSAVIQLTNSSFNLVVWEQEQQTGRVFNDEMTVRNTGLYRVFAADSTLGDTIICFTTTDQQQTTILDIPENYMITDVLTGYYGTPNTDCENPAPGSCHVDVLDIIRPGLMGKRSSNYYQGGHPDMCTGVPKTLFARLRCMKFTEDSVYVKQISPDQNFQMLNDTMVCAEALVDFSLPSLTCDTIFIAVDTLMLSVTSNNDVNSVPTKVGMPYKITVRNAVSYGGGAGNQADGAYKNITSSPIENITWRLDGMQYGTLPDFRPNPNAYNPEHEYEFFILGNGLPTVFRANDCCLGDNSGEFQFILSEMHIYNHCELNYLWSNGIVGPDVLLPPSETPTIVYLSDGLDHCPLDTVNVTSIESSLSIAGSPYVAICEGDSVILSASGPSDDFIWSNGIQNGQAFMPDTSAMYYVEGIVESCLEIDSIFVDVLTPTSFIDSQTACDSLTWIDGVTYTESTNSPTFVLQNDSGCDSIVTLDLSINYTSYNIIDTTVINIFEYNGEVYTEDGEYTVYLENQAGCDSIVTLKLDFEYVGVSDILEDNDWVVYPNPAINQITIAFDSDEKTGHISATNQLGQEVWACFVSGTYILDVSNWPRGLYVFHYTGDRIRQEFQVILE